MGLIRGTNRRYVRYTASLALSLSVLMMVFIVLVSTVHAASPTAPSYELLFSPKTGAGADATGDGGGGSDPYRYHEYYVGQNFTMTVRLLAGSAKVNGGDVQFDMPTGYLSCSLDSNVKPLSGAITMRTFTDPSSSDSPGLAAGSTRYWIVNSATTSTEFTTGTQNFARLNCTVLKKRENMLGTASPLQVKWYYQAGSTLDTNVAEFGTANDIIASAPEDAYLYLWPDTGKPYIDTFNPANGAGNIAVTAGVGFAFNDKNATSGDETGVNKGTLKGAYRQTSAGSDTPGAITWGACSGIWANNTCLGAFNPSTKIGGNRNYSYDTEYRVCLADGADLASASQSPADGAPNLMNGNSCTTFTTEKDTDKPAVKAGSYSPTGSSATVESNVVFTVHDVRAGGSTYGTGVKPETIKVNLAGKKAGNADFNLDLTCADDGVTCTPLGDALEDGHHYAYEVTIDPSNLANGENFDMFAQNETVQVRVSAAADFASNTMDDFAWSFTTKDTIPPEIINVKPDIDSYYSSAQANGGNITFEVVDSGVGVAQADVRVRIGDDIYQYGGENSGRITVTGDANHWNFTITPLQPLNSANTPNAITIDAKDQANNALDRPILYAIAPTGNDSAYDDGYAAGLEAGYGSAHFTAGATNGWQAGYNAAKTEFYDARYDEGYQAGLTAAGDGDYNTGYREGYDAGKSDGYNSGKADGAKEGYDKGYGVGLDDGKKSVHCNCSGGGSGNGAVYYPTWVVNQMQNNVVNTQQIVTQNAPQAVNQVIQGVETQPAATES